MIVPAFNAAPTIGETLESVIRQTFHDFEVIVVDDGSDDRTAAIVEMAAARDPRVSLLRKARGGVAAARNLAIENSSGEFVAPLDADDLWDPRKLERQVESFRDAPASVALSYCWWQHIDSRGRILYSGPRWKAEGRAFEKLLAFNFVGGASIPLIRREHLRSAGGYSERLRRANAEGCEDWDLYLRLADRFELRVVPETLVSYRTHPQSMSADSGGMQRSHELVLAEVNRLHPEIRRSTFTKSRANISLHLAGVQFRRSNLRGAGRWLLRALRLHPPTAVRFLLTSASTIFAGFLRRSIRR